MTVFEIGSLVVSVLATISAMTAIWFTHKQFKANIEFSKKQSKAIIEHNKLSMLPMLDIHTDTHTNKNIVTRTATLQNNGAGIAVIKKISLFIDDKIIKDKNPMGFIAKQILKDCSVKSEALGTFALGENGRGLLSGGEIILIKIEFMGKPSEADEEMIDGFNIKIDYESLDGKKYVCSA
jgi:hypothetical protein